MTSRTLRVSGYTRRAPIDRFAEIKARKTEQLRQELILEQLAREISAILDQMEEERVN